VRIDRARRRATRGARAGAPIVARHVDMVMRVVK
jgi:hypothetical protein